MALELNQSNVEEALKEKKITVLDFWAPWCGPCRMLGPIIDELSNDNSGKDVTIAKINVDENQDLAVKYGVRGIPTVVVLKEGEEKTRKVGFTSKAEFQSIIDGLL
jgi:thioredoxin 1